MPSPNAALQQLAAIDVHINEYDDVGTQAKKTLHAEGQAFLRQLAKDLDLGKGEFVIRSNAGGIAVSGEVTLHANNLYVQLGESLTGKGVTALFRHCDSRQDYTGGQNHFMALGSMLDGGYDRFVSSCRTVMEPEERPAARRSMRP